MASMLIGLVFLVASIGVIVIGISLSLYLFREGALAKDYYARHTLYVRDVPVEEFYVDRYQYYNLEKSDDTSARYARTGLIIGLGVLLLIVAMVISVFGNVVH
jgi:hypothetical protein